MEKASSCQPSPEELSVLARLGGVEASEANLAVVGPQAERFFEAALRLRGLDLAGVEPAFVFRAGKE